MAGSTVFGRGLGIKESMSLLTTAQELQTVPPWTITWISDHVELFGTVRSQKIVQHWPVFISWLVNELRWETVQADMNLLWSNEGGKAEQVNQQPVQTLTLTLTLSGFRDKNMERMKEWSTIVPNVHVQTTDTFTLKTDAVIVPTAEYTNSIVNATKVKKAKDRNLPVLCVAEVPNWIRTQAQS
jgi:hypothetical protein